MVDGEVMNAKTIEKLVNEIVVTLVDKPDQVSVTSTAGEAVWVIELKVDQDDIGKVIGRAGKTANAIRTLVNAAAGKAKRNIVLQIVEPNRAVA